MVSRDCEAGVFRWDRFSTGNMREPVKVMDGRVSIHPEKPRSTGANGNEGRSLLNFDE